MMQKILMIILMLLTISCNSLRPIVVKHISFEYDSCFTYCYNPNKMSRTDDVNCGKDFVSGQQNITECDKIIGVDIDLYAKYLRGKIKENISFCKDIAD